MFSTNETNLFRISDHGLWSGEHYGHLSFGISASYRRLFTTENEQVDPEEREKNGLVKYF